MTPAQVVAAVGALAIAAAAIWRHRELSRERLILFLVVAAGLGIYASGLLSALPDPKKVIGDVARALGPWTYALVGVFAYLETAAFVGLVAPGETIVIAGGVIAGQGEIDLLPLIGLVWICAVLGDTTSFFIGRRLGRPFLMKHGPRVKIDEDRLEQVESYFERHGGKTIVIGRFIGLVRSLAPFVVGSSGFRYRRFIPFSIVGTGLWATTFCLLGYIFWRSFDKVANVAGHAVFAFGVVAGVVVGIVVAYRRLRHPEERRRLAAWLDRQGRRPLLRPLFALARPVRRRVLRPVGRATWPRLVFLWERLTPGELGLELTTSLAVGGVGLYVFVLYTVILSGDPGPTPFDNQWLDLADKLRSTVGVDAAKFVSALGALPTAIGLVAGLSILLVTRRRPMELVGLLVAFALVVLAVHVAKAGVDRPRPPGELIHSIGSAYPSGHSAYSAAWVAAAVLVTRRLRLAGRAGLLVVAIVLSAAIGLSRIYLRAHFWSDVAGGWGLGYGIFGLVATVSLVVAHVRHNEGVGAPRGR